jgi:hypothetical protein
MFFQNFSIIRAIARELHLPKVKGVDGFFFFFFFKFSQNNF